uniref:Uncharacterized protein n=1 Tax=Panagrolaimus sp. ES5 TaxID=591445 RepID=A0AC34GR99_9BILA
MDTPNDPTKKTDERIFKRVLDETLQALKEGRPTTDILNGAKDVVDPKKIMERIDEIVYQLIIDNGWGTPVARNNPTVGEVKNEAMEAEHPDLKHVQSIHLKGAQYEGLTMDNMMKKHLKDWDVVFDFLADLYIKNQKLREKMLSGNFKTDPQKILEILRTLLLHDEIYDDIKKMLPALKDKKDALFQM